MFGIRNGCDSSATTVLPSTVGVAVVSSVLDVATSIKYPRKEKCPLSGLRKLLTELHRSKYCINGDISTIR